MMFRDPYLVEVEGLAAAGSELPTADFSLVVLVKEATLTRECLFQQ